jgi:hypothetical protein
MYVRGRIKKKFPRVNKSEIVHFLASDSDTKYIQTQRSEFLYPKN